MKAKLTLTIEKRIIEKAKKYAAAQNRSLSDLIETYLKALTNRDSTIATKESKPFITEKVRKLRGSLKVPKNLDYKKVVQEQIHKKYR